MIKIDKTGFEYEGTRLEIITELILMLNRFFADDVIDRHDLDEIVSVAMMSDEELQKGAEQGVLNMIKMLTDLYGADRTRDFLMNMFNK